EERSAAESRSREWKVALMKVLPTLLLILAGLLVGGTWSLLKQGAPRAAVVITGLLALLATAAGVLWLLPGES
uniref:hypothetical protein n=2 Tax=Micromonosporaceae TaxID=28056 RepID=UPI0035AF652D